MPVSRAALAGTLAALLGAGPGWATPAVDVDTTALAYWASKHDTVRTDAELRRLRSLYPNWTPPADPAALANAPSGSDEQALWNLFGADKLDELDAAIAARKAADPAWSPSPDLAGKLASKRARVALLSASDKGDTATVLDIAAKTPTLVTPGDLDVAWRVGDAYGRSGASGKALQLDEAILDGTSDPAARLATVRRAALSLSPDDLKTLMGRGHAAPDGQSEFAPVDLDLVRQRIGRALATVAADPDSRDASVAPGDVVRLEAAARTGKNPADAAMLGWWYAKRKDWKPANDWFTAALKAGPSPAEAKIEDAKVAQGAVLALRALARGKDAEDLAYDWRDADPSLALLYLDGVTADLTRPKPVALDADRLKRFGDAVGALRSGDGAQALGWYAYNIGQIRPARAWFEKAMAWQPRDTTALGLALSLKRGGDRAELKRFLAENEATFPAIKAVAGASGPSPDRVDAEPSAEPRRTEPGRTRRRVAAAASRARADAPAQPSGCPAAIGGAPRYADGAAALQAGWCLMALNRPREAALAFSAAREGGGARSTDVDAAYGQALADLRSQRTDSAVAAASSAALSASRRKEIGLAALAQGASLAFDTGRYDATLRSLDQRRRFTAEPRDLAMLRAWSTYHLGRKDDARALFRLLDQQLSTPDTRAGIAATDQPLR